MRLMQVLRHDKTRRSLSCFKKKPPVHIPGSNANASNAPSGLQRLLSLETDLSARKNLLRSAF